MISALSHLQPLNGSKLLFWVVFICVFSSCKPGKQLIDNSTRPNTNVPATTKVDTIIWKEDTTAPPPIKSDEVASNDVDVNDGNSSNEVPTSEQKNEYNISVLFPFYSGSYNIENEGSKLKSMRAIQVYGGMQLAMEKLEREGVNLNFNVADTKGASEVTQRLLQQSNAYNADLIFGPFRSENLRLGAETAKQLKTAFISPMNPSNKITKDNPYYVQVKPGLDAHLQAITDHVIAADYAPEQVVIVARNKAGEKQRIQMLQDALANNRKAADDAKFREYLVSDYGNEFENMDFTNYFIEGGKTVFIVPSWSSESFINNVLRKIRLMKGENEVVVYGMPQWKKFERVSYDYYDALDVHISSDNRLDKSKTNIQNFAKAYFYKFGEAPNEDAYLGYDMTLYLVRMLIKHGDQFQAKLSSEPFTGLASQFNFETVYDLDNDDLETAPIKYIENKHVNILQFKDFIFQVAK